jgi:DNA-binding transcriptional LysR family regulator
MDPAARLRTVWPWLPAFKVVAETEHLPTAARRLHVSASALSRTVRLIEDALGQELFVRAGRRLVLSSAGQRLLDAVRRSQLSLEQGIQHAVDPQLSGPYRVSSLGVITDYFVLPSLLALREQHRDVQFRMVTHLASDANRLLASGLLDIAFYYDPTAHEGVYCRMLGSISNGIYCGRPHPLFSRRRVTTSDVLREEFSVASIGDHGTPMDSWPVDRPRRIGFQIMMLSTNLEVALSGQFITVLPDVVAAPHVAAERLRKLDASLVPATAVYAACREADADHPLTRAVMRAVGERIGAKLGRKPRFSSQRTKR